MGELKTFPARAAEPLELGDGSRSNAAGDKVAARPRDRHSPAVRRCAERMIIAKDECDEEEAWRHLAREVSRYRAAMLARGVDAFEAERHCEMLAQSVIEDAEWIAAALLRLIAFRMRQRQQSGLPAWRVGTSRSVRHEIGCEVGRGRAPGWSERLEAMLRRAVNGGAAA
jgi:hypothetical protein